MAKHTFFVTGTDTGVGKTIVSAAILEAAKAAGKRTLAMKPIASGCDQTPEGLRNEDALMLQAANATVTVAHSRTADLAAHTREADIVVVAAGRPGIVGLKHIRPGSTVVDVGIHRKPEGGLCGDVVAEEVEPIAVALSPVPGGVGPMTVTMLLVNTVVAWCRRHENDHGLDDLLG